MLPVLFAASGGQVYILAETSVVENYQGNVLVLKLLNVALN